MVGFNYPLSLSGNESRKKELRYDSIHRANEKARKEAHEEYVRKMARDIVNSGRRERSRDNMRGWEPAWAILYCE